MDKPDRNPFVTVLWLMGTATLMLFLVLAAMGIAGYVLNEHRAHEGQQAHAFACALREERIQDIARQQKYLADVKHHRRKAVPGIEASDVLASIKLQRATVSAIDKNVDC